MENKSIDSLIYRENNFSIIDEDKFKEKLNQNSIKIENILKFGKFGQNKLQFNNPWDIIVDCDNNYYICESENNRIQK